MNTQKSELVTRERLQKLRNYYSMLVQRTPFQSGLVLQIVSVSET